jgi:hypothetical protein
MKKYPTPHDIGTVALRKIVALVTVVYLYAKIAV